MTSFVYESQIPLWNPLEKSIVNANLTHFMKTVGKLTYGELYTWSIQNVEGFWEAIWSRCKVIGKSPSHFIIENKEDVEKALFFKDAYLNFSENVLRRRDDATAITFYGEEMHHYTLSYKDLYNQVSRLEQFLTSVSLRESERVGCYLPNIPEAIIGMLATATHGAIWSTCSPDFGTAALIDRFGQITPRILFIADGYYYNGKTFAVIDKLSKILEAIPSIEHVIVIPYLKEAPLTLPECKGVTLHLWDDIVKNFPATDITFKQFPFNHPLYILYSSGTTGIPKCIIHSAGGTLLQHLKEHQLHCDIKRDDVIFYFTTCSWMMWHWLVSVLASEASILLYDGSPTYPRLDILFELADRHKVKLFGTSAKYLDSLSKNNINVKNTYALEKLCMITSTGSPLLPATFDYVYEHIKTDLCLASISGGTDIISCFVLGNPVAPVYRGEIQTAGLGLAVDVYRPDGTTADVGEQGELVCLTPFPSRPLCFWNDGKGERYHKAYFARFPNVWHHGDFIAKTIHKGFVIVGRSDAVLNPGGVRIGTAEIYRQVETLDFIMESLAIGQPFDGDERVLLFVRLKEGVILTEDLISIIKQHIRQHTTPRHVPAKIIQVPDIPRTKNNKIAELAVKQTILGKAVDNTSALLNPESLNYFKNLRELLY